MKPWEIAGVSRSKYYRLMALLAEVDAVRNAHSAALEKANIGVQSSPAPDDHPVRSRKSLERR